MLHIYTVVFLVSKNQHIRTLYDTKCSLFGPQDLVGKKDITVNCIFNYMGSLNWFQVDASPARWWVWISSRPVKVLSDLRSLKATTGTMSSSLVSPSCKVLVPAAGSWAASSMVPLCTGSVFSFGWAAFGELLAGAVFCRNKNIKNYQLSQGQTVWLWKVKLVSC